MWFAAADAPISWQLQIVGLIAIPVLVALNGFFVAAEFSLVAVRRTRVQELIQQGVSAANAVLKAIDHLDNAIAATQLGITLSSIGLGFVAEASLAAALESWFSYLPPSLAFLATHSAAAAIAFTIITFMHVVFGELFPKTLALQAPDRIALWIAKPLNWFVLISRPLIVVMNGTGNYFVRLCGFQAAPGSHMVHSVDELALLIEDTEEAGILDADQALLVQNVFSLSNKTVKDCMVPRDKMAVLELTSPPEKILEAVRSGAHTRMPVCDGAEDKIVGIVNTKDLFYLFSLKGVVILEDALYPPLFLKPDEEVANALRLFRKAKRPMALVRDDDGKIHGLITLEDILEEIIGDIEDEHDQTLRRRVVLRRSLRRRPPAKKDDNGRR